MIVSREIVKALITVLIFLTINLKLDAKEQSQIVPGTSVSMTPPNQFTLSSSFSGFENLQDQSSITIAELPSEAFVEIQAIFSDLATATAAFAHKGMEVESREIINTKEQSVTLLTGIQRVSGMSVRKHMALFKGENTVLITFNLMGNNLVTKDKVVSTLKSVDLHKTPSIDTQIAQLPFKFEEAAPFKSSSVLMNSAVVLTTFADTDPTGLLPMAVIASAIVDTPGLQTKTLSELLLKSTAGFEQAMIIEAHETTFVQTSGYFVKAEFKDKLIIQYVALVNDRYIRFLSNGEAQAINKLEPIIEKIARSVEVKN